jgi:hypothetical protein
MSRLVSTTWETDVTEVLYPDGHLAEVSAGITLDDVVENRFFYPPLSWWRYKDSGRVKLIKAGTPPAAPSIQEAERVLRLTDNTGEGQ